MIYADNIYKVNGIPNLFRDLLSKLMIAVPIKTCLAGRQIGTIPDI
jgi:hypothetical protein